jgi:hypothetical protein
MGEAKQFFFFNFFFYRCISTLINFLGDNVVMSNQGVKHPFPPFPLLNKKKKRSGS